MSFNKINEHRNSNVADLRNLRAQRHPMIQLGTNVPERSEGGLPLGIFLKGYI